MTAELSRSVWRWRWPVAWIFDPWRRGLRRLRHGMLAVLPRTMTGLVAAGCLLAATPLLATVLINSLVLESLTQRSEHLMGEGLRLERLGAQLRRHLEDLERGGLQYLALEDPALLPVIERRRGAAEETLRQIQDERLAPAVAERAERFELGLRSVAAQWMPQSADAQQLLHAMHQAQQLAIEADALVAAGRSTIDERVGELRERSRKARRLTPLAILALMPLTAMLAWLCSIAITRPLASLQSAIVAIGAGDHDKPVRIDYPLEMARLGHKLDWLRRRLRHLELDKERFLRHISHELNTPLASMREGVDLLRAGTLGPLNVRQAEVAGILQESAQELDTQIRNLLAYAQWRRERHSAEAAWFEIQPLIEEVLAAHRLPLARKQLQVDLQLDCPRLHGQRGRLRVALDNLLSNAVKHAPPASVIEIVAACGSGNCELGVRDFGRGVAIEDRERILEPFVRGSEAEEAGIRGTGIGLSIVHETALAHGGELEVQDAHPGARFLLIWPVAAEGEGNGVA